MYTQCQHCQVWFRIGAQALRAGHGRVRCGCCGEVFDALLALRDSPPPGEALPGNRQEPAAIARQEPPAGAVEEVLLERPEMEPEPELEEERVPAFALHEEDDEEGTEEGGLPDWALESLPGELQAPAEEPPRPEPAAEQVAPGPDGPARDEESLQPGEPTQAEETLRLEEPVAEEETLLLEEPTRAGETVLLDDPAQSEATILLEEPALAGEPRPEREQEEQIPAPQAEERGEELLQMPAMEPDPLEAGPPPWEIPDEALRQKVRRGWPLLWGVGSLLLLLALLLQGAAYYHRQVEERFPQLAPLTGGLCRFLPCSDPVPRPEEQVVVVARDVRSHPRFADTLLVNATLENRGGTKVPFPLLELDIYDTAGRLIAARRFRPAEYLAPGMQVEAGMPPGVPVHILLEVAGAGEQAVSFQFRFLPPDAPA